MTKISKAFKNYSRCVFAVALAALIVIAALCFLAHSFEVSEMSFSPSQICKLSGEEGESPEISSKIGEELSGLFDKKQN